MEPISPETEVSRTSGGSEARGSRQEPVELTDPDLYFNRELSWLDFNERVLELAEDSTVPLLERVRFLSIFETNLDEFFMVRIAGMHDAVDAKLGPQGADELPPSEVIAMARERVVGMRSRIERCLYGELRPQLAENGIRLVDLSEVTEDERAQLDSLYRNQIFPTLTPLVIGRGRRFPYFSNVSLSIGVLLLNPETGEEVVARVKVPKENLSRFIATGDGRTFVPIEQVIAANLGDLFPGMEIVHHSLFRVTRDTDYDVNDEAGDLLRAVEEEVRRRRFGEVVRLELSDDMEPRLRELLISSLEVEEGQVYDSTGLLGIGDLEEIASVSGFESLCYPAWSGVTPGRLLEGKSRRKSRIFDSVRESALLVHHPYDSFTATVGRFIDEAVEDPEVLAIKQTVYRTGADSPLVGGLIEATARGKQAVCMVELKARFDENANIRWAKSMEEAGVHVVYGIPGLKTHCKCALVVRREGDGVRHYVHIGTGNYNPKTARLYTDLGLFTADPEIGADIAEMFNYLTGYARPKAYRKVLVAPFNLKDGIVAEIEKTIEAHQAGTPARIRMKMNSLLDPESIRAIYRASQAGVPVEINTRGICALRPGVPGVSENIRVVSILGRFLEHSRIYAFERGDDSKYLIGSADLMPRNLYNRVELLVPVEDRSLQSELSGVLDLAFSDNSGSWELGSDGAWSRLPEGEVPRSLQGELMASHAERSNLAAKDLAD